MRTRLRRYGQVLVYPWVHPAAVLAVVIAVLVAVVACTWNEERPATAPRGFARVVREFPAAARPPARPRLLTIDRDGTAPDALSTSRAGHLKVSVLGLTLQNGPCGRPVTVGIEPYGLLVRDSVVWPVSRAGGSRVWRVAEDATVKFHVAPWGRHWARSLSDTPFYDAPAEPRTRLVFAGERIPHLERAGFAGQPSLREILGHRVKPDGTARLDANQALLLWEFTSEFHSPAADFQDVVALVELM